AAPPAHSCRSANTVSLVKRNLRAVGAGQGSRPQAIGPHEARAQLEIFPPFAQQFVVRETPGKPGPGFFEVCGEKISPPWIERPARGVAIKIDFEPRER